MAARSPILSLRRALYKEPELEIGELFQVRAWCEERLGYLGSVLVSKMLATECFISPAEMKVAGLIAQYKTMKEVGQVLNVSSKTAGTHAARLRQKLGVHHNAQIGAWFRAQLMSIPASTTSSITKTLSNYHSIPKTSACEFLDPVS